MTSGVPAPDPRCDHADFAASVTVNRLEDTGRFVADVTIECARCGELFRFIGLPSGVSPYAPMVSVDGLELRAPIEPQIVPMLAERSTFTVPPPEPPR